MGAGRSLRSEEAHRREAGGRKQNTEVAEIANKRERPEQRYFHV